MSYFVLALCHCQHGLSFKPLTKFDGEPEQLSIWTLHTTFMRAIISSHSLQPPLSDFVCWFWMMPKYVISWKYTHAYTSRWHLFRSFLLVSWVCVWVWVCIWVCVCALQSNPYSYRNQFMVIDGTRLIQV